MFTDLPPQLSPEELDNFVNRLKNGDESVVQPLIMSHMRLGTTIAMRIIKRTGQNGDDILGEMALAITTAVRDCGPPNLKLHDNNITAYIAKTVKYKLKSWIESNRTFGMPGRTMRHHVQHGNLEKLERPAIQVGLTFHRELKLDDSNRFVQLSHSAIPNYCVVPIVQPDKTYEIMDILEASTFDLIEKRIIELRAEGYTYAEISPQVGLSTSQIGVKVSTIEERFTKYYKKA